MTAAEAMSRAPEVRAPRTHLRTVEGKASNGEVLNQDRLRPGPRLRTYVRRQSVRGPVGEAISQDRQVSPLVKYVRGTYLPFCLSVAVSGTSAGPKATQLPLSAAQRVEGDEGVQMERRGGLCDGGRMGGGWDREGWRWRRGRR